MWSDGHGLKDCGVFEDSVKTSLEEELPYSVALKAESNLMGR